MVVIVHSGLVGWRMSKLFVFLNLGFRGLRFRDHVLDR